MQLSRLVLSLPLLAVLAACSPSEESTAQPIEITAGTACSLDGMILADFPGPKGQIHYASGAAYGVRLLQVMRAISGIETHLVISAAGKLNLRHELDANIADIESLADVVHAVSDVGAAIASGSFRSAGMVIAPCSMRTLAAVAHGLSDNLITRAADVTLKERRHV